MLPAKNGAATPTIAVLVFHSVVVMVAAAIPAGSVIGARTARHTLFPPHDLDAGSLVFEGFMALCAVLAVLIFGSAFIALVLGI